MDRYEIAWRIWCWQEGYVEKEDREILKNWMRDDDSLLTQNDIASKKALLAIADEVIELAKKKS